MITSVVLAYNEQDRIKNCLRSLQWCSEIIVLDMQSDDRTRELAIQMNSKVITVAKRDDFDILRIHGIEAAKNDWILFVDADEIVPKSLSIKIVESINDSVANIYSIPRLNYVLGTELKGCGYWPDYQIKLFKRGSISLTGKTHEFIHINNNEQVIKFPLSEKTAIHHFTNRSVSDFVQKMDKYTEVQSSFKFKKNLSNKSILLLFVKTYLFRFFRARGFKSKIGSDFSVLLAVYESILYLKLKYPRTDYRNEINKLLNEYD